MNFFAKLDQPGNDCLPPMNFHQEARFPHLAADLNVILLSHWGTESCPWVAKGYSVANEVCTGPWVVAVSRQSFLIPQGSRTVWPRRLLSTGIHLTLKQWNTSTIKLGFSLVVLIPSTLNTHFNMHFTHYVRVNKKSLWECAHCWVSLLIMTAQSAAVSDWLIRRMIIHQPR